MPYAAIPVRFVRPVGWSGTVDVSWGVAGDCQPNRSHSVRSEVARGDGEPPRSLGDVGVDFTTWHPDDGTPCDRCSAVFQEEVAHRHSGGVHVHWSTESGKLEPGCLYWADWNHRDEHGNPAPCPKYLGGWENCSGRHLMAVTPSGRHWDVDGRASNCTKPDDRIHRCWVRHGDPETGRITVDKNGDTCNAGGGSIADGAYHGFMRDGAFTAG